MQWTAWSTLAALVLYVWVLFNVGRARVKYGVIAPATDGPVEFLRIQRVQENTVEQIILFLPALWMCGVFLSDKWAALGGAIWIISRIVYALGYYRAAPKRTAGFGIASLATLALMIGAAAGLLMH